MYRYDTMYQAEAFPRATQFAQGRRKPAPAYHRAAGGHGQPQAIWVRLARRRHNEDCKSHFAHGNGLRAGLAVRGRPPATTGDAVRSVVAARCLRWACYPAAGGGGPGAGQSVPTILAPAKQ